MGDHRSGKKISKSHTTVIDAAKPFVDHARKDVYVTKIVLGPIKQVRSGPQRSKIVEVPSGLKVSVRGTASIQLLYIYTKNTAHTRKNLESIL